jgi:hypothetical protein
MPCFFFFRRFVTAVILVMGATDRAPAYLQFAIIVSLSAIHLFYVAKEEPYVMRRMSKYVASMELIYFTLAISLFVFTDATGDVDFKLRFGIVCLVLLCLFILSNFLMAVYFATKGRPQLKILDKRSKEFRKSEDARR